MRDAHTAEHGHIIRERFQHIAWEAPQSGQLIGRKHGQCLRAYTANIAKKEAFTTVLRILQDEGCAFRGKP